jgi:hypothetical protein
MRITNNLLLPAPLFRALAHDGYTPGTKKADISVTTLIGSPLISELKRRHAAEITEDASARVWSLLGQSIHRILELAEDETCIVEKRLYMPIEGWTITGQTDLLEEGGILSDFKVTSVFSFLLGQKKEWVAQVNLNAMLWRHAGHEINRGQIVAILRDWSSRKAMIDKEYPQSPALIVDIPLWSQEECIKYAQERIELHRAARSTKNEDQITGCTKEEKWVSEEAYAVMKVGNKKATRVFKTEAEAKAYVPEIQAERPKDKFEIVHRPGEDVRCTRFCTVKQWCKYFKATYPNSIVTDTEETE